jgi:rubrerythrin
VSDDGGGPAIQEEHVLICTDCGVESPSGAADWRGYLAEDNEILFPCPACSEREFEAG